MLTFRVEDILSLRDPGGRAFAGFVSGLIRVHARAHGIPDAAIRTNLSTTVGDGGVDAAVDATATDDPTGRMIFPTAWQFKATAADQGGPAELRTEIGKVFARELVAGGASYAFCVCDQLTPQRKSAWEAALHEAALQISPEAAPSQVLEANDLAAWASEYPALALAERPWLAETALTLRKWGESVTRGTPMYVSTPALEAALQAIQRHAAFDEQPIDVVLTVRGSVGVGTSRMVYEALTGLSGAAGLVLYTLDGDTATRLAYQLANADTFAILVANECTARTSDRLRQLLDGHSDHVRVVAIESTEGAYRRADSDALCIEEVSNTTVDGILAANFPQVLAERRRAFARISEGFVRFAVDLCRRDADFAPDQILRPTPFVGSYLRARLSDEEQEIVEALSLVDGIGYREEVTAELDRLASLVDLDVAHVVRVVRRIREAPGFVATAGRYVYIKPPIVAQVAFEDAWARWGADQPGPFLVQIADDPRLLRRFLRRVTLSGSDDVRRLVAGQFAAWAAELTPANLTNPTDVDRLVSLVQVEPLNYLPVLRRLVEQAPADQLLADTEVGPGRRNVRHQLVKTAERTASLPECFLDAEAILLRLAVHESDPRLSNNATGTYRQLFQPILSGTRVPLADRLNLLGLRLQADDARVATLAVEALGDVFNMSFSRGLDEPLLAGRIIGGDWEPATMGELRAGQARAFELLREAAVSPNPVVQASAWNVAIPKLGTLARFGFAGELITLFPPEIAPLEVRSRVVAEAERFLVLAGRPRGGQPAPRLPFEDNLRGLIEALGPTDLHGRLVTAVGLGRLPRIAFGGGDERREELDALALELLAPLNSLVAELDWLCTDGGHAAYYLGRAVGGHDTNGEAIAEVADAARRHPEASFPRGYVAGLAAVVDPPGRRLNEEFDGLEADAPAEAFALAASAGDVGRAFDRAMRLVDRGAVSPAWLGWFASGINGRSLTEAEFKDALRRLVVAVEGGDAASGRAALDLASRRIGRDKAKPKRQRVIRLKIVRQLLVRLLSATAAETQGEDDLWEELAESLIPFDGQRVVGLAASAVSSGDIWQSEMPERLLARLASDYPEAVMAELGRLLLAEESKYYVRHSYRSIVDALPEGVLRAWLEDRGIEGARALALHLPRPYPTLDGGASVPAATMLVLDRFGEDIEVQQAFRRGSMVRGTGDDEEDGWILTTDLARAQKMARVAPALLQHPSGPIREWARWIQLEVEDAARLHASLNEELAERRFR